MLGAGVVGRAGGPNPAPTAVLGRPMGPEDRLA